MSGERPQHERIDLRRWGVLLRLQARQGWRRVRAASVPVLTAATAAALAWAVAYYLLGHAQPFFAPIAAWVCLGFSADREVRKVAELAIGVSLGVALGELVVYVLGAGVLQIVLVVVVAALIARFIDRGQLLTVQAGVNGIVIVALPTAGAVDGGTGRWTDALVGGVFALLVAAATPGDARQRARQLAGGSLSDLAGMLRTLGRALQEGDGELVRDALAQGRGTQGVLDEWSEVVRNARQSARISPAARRFLPELARLERASTLADRAMRSTRVIARRELVAVEQGVRDQRVAGALMGLADGAEALGDALGAGDETGAARVELESVVEQLDPGAVTDAGWDMQTLVILMRSLTVDLLQAAGLSATEASRLLAEGDQP